MFKILNDGETAINLSNVDKIFITPIEEDDEVYGYEIAIFDRDYEYRTIKEFDTLDDAKNYLEKLVDELNAEHGGRSNGTVQDNST